ncbi:MAG: DUF1559 domain-containing protein [Planctomycetota bacterium]|nr:MAG: DUF1559 domain-containing protein [Planctomycetota bacterium]
MDSEYRSDDASGDRREKALWLVGICIVLALLLFFFLPGIEPARSRRRHPCTSNLRRIGAAMHTYHDEFGTFPPAYVADENGVPMHSWRVLLLPYLEEEGYHRLYEKYRFDEPWNGPNNRKLADVAFPPFHCPSSEREGCCTNYVAIVGPETVWPGTATRSVTQITDGTSETVLVAEFNDSDIHWMEPRDLTFNEACRGINGSETPGISSPHGNGTNLLFCDMSVHFVTDDLPHDTLRALLTADGGEPLERDDRGEWVISVRDEDPDPAREDEQP